MRLVAGAPAPLFTAIDTNNQTMDLAALRGQPILLSFYRSATCPLCSLRVWYMAQKAPVLQARGLRIVAVFESPRDDTLHFCNLAQPPQFPLIADPDRRLYSQYGIGYSWAGVLVGFARRALNYAQAFARRRGKFMTTGVKHLMPADFLIAPDLTISVAHYGRDTGDHIPPAAIERFLARYEDAPTQGIVAGRERR